MGVSLVKRKPCFIVKFLPKLRAYETLLIVATILPGIRNMACFKNRINIRQIKNYSTNGQLNLWIVLLGLQDANNQILRKEADPS
jgi:hypothetical protein